MEGGEENGKREGFIKRIFSSLSLIVKLIQTETSTRITPRKTMKGMKVNLFLFIFLIIFVSNLMSQNKWAYFGNTTNSCLNYIDIGDISIPGNKLTVEASFILIPNNTKCISTPHHDIVSKHYDNSDVNYLLRPDHCEINTTAGFYKTNPVFISDDNCHHVAMVYDGRYLKFFLDSSFVDSVAVIGDVITNSYSTKIGNTAGLNPNWVTQFWGFIDELRIWNVTRSEKQLKQFAFSNLKDPDTHDGLIGYYDFQNGFTNMQGNIAYNGNLVGDVQLEILKNDCIKLLESEPEKEEKILISPNPVTFKLYINLGDTYTKAKRITLFNVLGQIIFQTVNINELNEINMANFITGVYFVNITFDDKTFITEKIVKFDIGYIFR